MTKAVRCLIIAPLALLPFLPFVFIVTDMVEFKASGLFRTNSLVCDLFLLPPMLLGIFYRADPKVILCFVFVWALLCSWGLAKAAFHIINIDNGTAVNAAYPFDWWRFWVRFACGAFIGMIMGWRMWASISRNTPTNLTILFICISVGGVVAGLFVAFTREDFWRRP